MESNMVDQLVGVTAALLAFVSVGESVA